MRNNHIRKAALALLISISAEAYDPIEMASYMGNNPINKLIFFPDDHRLLIVGARSRIWDYRVKRVLHELVTSWDTVLDGIFYYNHYEDVDGLVSPDGKTAITISYDNYSTSEMLARIWDAETGRLKHRVGVKSQMATVFSHDGMWILAHPGNPWDAGHLDMIDVGSGWRRILEVQDDTVDVQFSPSDEQIASLGRKELILWDAHSGDRITEIPLSDRGGAGLALGFSPDGARIAIGKKTGRVDIFDVIGGVWQHQDVEIPYRGDLRSIRYVNDGNTIVCDYGPPFKVCILDAKTLKVEKQIDQVLHHSRESSLVLSTGDHDDVNIWDIRDGLGYTIPDLFIGHLAISDDGFKIAYTKRCNPYKIKVKHLPLWRNGHEPTLRDLALLAAAEHYLTKAVGDEEMVSFERFKDHIGVTLLENIQTQSPRSFSYVRALIDSHSIEEPEPQSVTNPEKISDALWYIIESFLSWR